MREEPGVHPQTILIVDDDELGTEVRAAVLGASGYRVSVAALAQQALALSAVSDFDLIIVDFDLPDIDGVRLAYKFRETGFDGPVLMLSGRLHAPDCPAIDRFISKGESGLALIEVVANLLVLDKTELLARRTSPSLPEA